MAFGGVGGAQALVPPQALTAAEGGELGEGNDAVAEGVESERMVQALSELGASHGQGFHLCPALPAEECASWCRRRLRAGNPGGEATGPGPRLARIAGGA